MFTNGHSPYNSHLTIMAGLSVRFEASFTRKVAGHKTKKVFHAFCLFSHFQTMSSQ